ncbi:MAG: acetolactate synthase large subunit [Deltaproteobacteria bacterium]|nr:acetolactate synthase large subunit [Deltaproteobacteria bacterium]
MFGDVVVNGAEALLRTGAAAGIEYCFCNPGSTEMELLVAFDAIAELRPVLGLHENVCTGMADGYGRMADRPAFTLMHQGAGLSNGSANLHNARKAPSPIVNLVGKNAERDPDLTPLAADVLALARPVSHWCKVASSSQTVAADTAEAIATARQAPGQVATLILPANAQSGSCAGPVEPLVVPPPRSVDGGVVDRVARVVTEHKAAVALVLHASALNPRGLDAAGRIAAVTGCTLLAESIPRRWERGAGLPAVRMIPCLVPSAALEALKTFRSLILVGATRYQPYFLLEDTPAPLIPSGCDVVELASAGEDIVGALEALADALDAPRGAAIRQQAGRPGVPTGTLTASAINAVVGALLPEGAIVVQTSTSGARDFLPLTQGCPPHSLLFNTGASIGWGMPAAAGAALACPDRRVISLAADGGDVLSIQALWTQAREGLNVTTIVFCNREYKILRNEIERLTKDPGPRARSLLSLENPAMDFVLLARGMGVPASRAETAESLHEALGRALREPGPHLIEAVI